MTTLCLCHLNASQITLKHFNVKKINISIARFNKVESSGYPHTFHQQSLPTKAEGHIVRILELKSLTTKMQMVHFVFIVEQDAPPTVTSKMDYGC